MTLETAAVERFVAEAWKADAVTASGASMMSGGAIQENWALDLAVTRDGRTDHLETVLRTDAPSSIPQSHGRAEEYALFSAAHAAGVAVPKPLLLGRDVAGMDRPFFLMQRVAGQADPRKITRGDLTGAPLARALGAELARIHSITPGAEGLGFLDLPDESPAKDRVAEFRAALDASERPQPVIEWGVRWLELNAPPAPDALVLCHNDFRTGNYILGPDGTPAILDWEFAGWGDRHADLGWFCAKCWRFGQDDREAGGIGPRAEFYAGYEDIAGPVIDRDAVPFWEMLATVRWAVIALRQGDRFLQDGERSLELALTRHVVPTLEIDILDQTGELHA
ncbi:phosphotransferase family protein [Maribius pontilimi]|uniref:Phosphotransferase family protein n=1 Tax=Palleronia pontilimi TaxID=1964209 RepID=A0A934IFP0_9RHOB|nr:phosphotransferase family protein [Palleronia pontilimi]MBJ3762028.1 phosphotransferase family protein [Palleronia pontilimi]